MLKEMPWPNQRSTLHLFTPFITKTLFSVCVSVMMADTWQWAQETMIKPVQ
jgi:hypothetical protein